MSSNNKAKIYFGDKTFINVTNETTSGPVFSFYEAKIYGEEDRIVASNM